MGGMLMISRLIRLFLDAPVLALALALLLAAWGWQSFLDNPKDALPDIAKKPDDRIHRMDGAQPQGR